MKRIVTLMALLATVVASAQNTQTAAAEAAAALSAAEDVPEKVEKPRYWTNKLVTNISFGQTFLSQWAAGGYNNVSLSGTIDGSANYAKGKLVGTNHLVMDYGFLYSADKPILQKNKDRILFESKWGYETPVKHLAYSASFDFRTQFNNNYDYKTPATTQDAEGNVIEPSVADWLDARKLKSGLFSPAYINVGVGALWTPKPWFSLNIAPISGGAVIVSIPELRKTYGMALVEGSTTEYRSARMEFGTQLKLDMGWVINENFSYNTQATLFYNYLTPKVEPRITWDNKISWKVARFFAINLSTYMIYDPLVQVNPRRADGKGLQFKEFLELGFTYSIANKK
jgi:hypothetical protein